MLTVAEIDRLLARALGATDVELRYVRWIQARGLTTTSLGEIFIERGIRSTNEVRDALEPWRSELTREDFDRALGTRSQEPYRSANAARDTSSSEDVVRATNLLLLTEVVHARGAAARIEVDAGRVVAGIDGAFEPVKTHVTLDALARRLRVMANVTGAPPTIGRIHLITSDQRREVELTTIKTDRGESVLARRVLSWRALWPEDARFAKWRDAMTSRAYDRAAEVAREIGIDATLEEIDACVENAFALLELDRDADARQFAERALALAEQHTPFRSILCSIKFLVAATRTDAPALRADLTTEALTLAQSGSFLEEKAWMVGVARAAGRPDDAIALARAAEDDAMKWYGGIVGRVVDAWAYAAHADLDLGNVDAARARMTRVRDAARTLDLPQEEALARWIEGRAFDVAGAHGVAVDHLRAARDALGGIDPEIDAHVALALAHAGRASEAQAEARNALARLSPALTPVVRALEQLAHQTGPFR